MSLDPVVYILNLVYLETVKVEFAYQYSHCFDFLVLGFLCKIAYIVWSDSSLSRFRGIHPI